MWKLMANDLLFTERALTNKPTQLECQANCLQPTARGSLMH